MLDLLIRARLEGELSDRSRNNLYLALCTILRAHQRSSLCCFFVSCRVICCFLLQQRDRVSFCRNNKIQNYFRGGVIRVRHTSSNELDYFTVPYGTCNFNLVQYRTRVVKFQSNQITNCFTFHITITRTAQTNIRPTLSIY